MMVSSLQLHCVADAVADYRDRWLPGFAKAAIVADPPAQSAVR